MFLSTSLALLSCAALASPAPLADRRAPELNVYYETDPLGYKFTARLEGATGQIYAVFAHADGFAPLLLGRTQIGHNINFTASREAVESLEFPISFTAKFVRRNQLVTTGPADLLLGVSQPCEELNFNHTIGSDEGMVAGNLIDDEWTEMGMTVSARNKNASHPDKAILFDSANPTGGDDDLMTPNPAGFDNDTALGHVLIIAENDEDSAPGDDLVDDPDDEAAGGSLYFDFNNKATICSATLLDIDEALGTELRFYRNGDLATPDETISILTLGDGSVQRVEFNESEVDRFEVYFKGSGAVGRIELVPCPQIVNFDETSTGASLAFQTGETIAEQYTGIGLHISAINNDGDHPDKVILFDTANPTGGDDDLLTPNPMVAGNDTALGFVMIIAENDGDTMPMDGLVDDPDDEAAGGTIFFRFDSDVTILSATVLDVDANEVDFWRFLDKDDNEIAKITIPDLPNGNVQLISPNISGVRRAMLQLGGSGAITALRFCPDPAPTTGTPPK